MNLATFTGSLKRAGYIAKV